MPPAESPARFKNATKQRSPTITSALKEKCTVMAGSSQQIGQNGKKEEGIGRGKFHGRGRVKNIGEDESEKR